MLKYYLPDHLSPVDGEDDDYDEKASAFLCNNVGRTLHLNEGELGDGTYGTYAVDNEWCAPREWFLRAAARYHK